MKNRKLYLSGSNGASSRLKTLICERTGQQTGLDAVVFDVPAEIIPKATRPKEDLAIVRECDIKSLCYIADFDYQAAKISEFKARFRSIISLARWIGGDDPEKPRDGNGKAVQEADEVIRNTAYKFSNGGELETLISSVLFGLSGAIQGGYLAEFQSAVIEIGDKLCLKQAAADQAEREIFAR